METNRVKRENRQALPKFLLVVLCGAVVGGTAGGILASEWAARLAGGAGAALDRGLTLLTPWGILVSGVVLLGISFGFYRSAKRIYRGWDGEDEAAAGAAEEKLSYALLLSSVEMVIGFFFLSASYLYAGSGNLMGVLLVMAEFIAVVVGIVALQQRAVDLTRAMNPEKRGSVYDLKFQRKWLESCDEAQRSQVFEASYHAFRVVSRTCVTLWLILVFLGFLFPIGLLPTFVVLVIWGVAQASYALAAIRMGRQKRG